MKLSVAATSLFFLNYASGQCATDPLEWSETIAMKVEKVGSVPAQATGAFSYNMHVMDNFDGDTIYFLDQQFGLITSYDHSTSETKLVFDIASSDIPDGLTLDYIYGSAGQIFKVKSMTQGSSSDEVYVVFSSTTLPTGWTEADATLPPAGAYSQWVCGPDNPTWVRDIYRPGTIPECSNNGAGLVALTGYDVFYKYTVVDGDLTSPEPFFVSETVALPGHMGGGIVTVDNGKVLYSNGDCTIFGLDGSYAPQLDYEACGKILLIDPSEKGSFKIAAKGVRNSQQMRVFSKSDRKPNLVNAKKILAFADIGGVTAEEVNAKPLAQILNTSNIDNFGWGRSTLDGKAREGTFYVEPGNGLILGTEPACTEQAPSGEAGFNQPWIQFGRSETDAFYAISSFAVPYTAVNKLELIWSEFNTGHIMGTVQKYQSPRKGYGGPAPSFKIKLYDADGNYLENSLNDLVQAELGEVGYYRGDPRLFHYPDGQAGVFIERTGVFYKLTEIEMP